MIQGLAVRGLRSGHFMGFRAGLHIYEESP